MGQYFKLANLDKKEFVNPGTIGDGLKQWEICANGDTARLAMFLMTMGDNDGGAIRGRWANDKVVLVGDYDPSGLYAELKPENGWTDVTRDATHQFNAFIDDESLMINPETYKPGTHIRPDLVLVAGSPPVVVNGGGAGWHREPARHALAAKGVKTGRSRRK